MMDMEDKKNELNEGQRKVVNYGKGCLLVEAGPGSGKTTVIVERIKHLINDVGVDPESFLVITFSTKAADNLKNKLRKYLPNDIILKMQISTIHSFCLDYLKSKNQSLTLIDDDASERKTLLIKKFREELGFVNEATVLDYHIPAVLKKFGEYTCFNVDSDELIEKISDSRPISKYYIDFVDSLDYFSKKRIDDSDKILEKLRKEKPDECNDWDVFRDSWYNARYLQIAKAYPKYLELLDEYDYVDYDTLQLKALKELENNPQTKYKTIFVDEFQDTDPLQYRLFQVLRKNADYFTAVGDVDQHIYAFRSSFNDFFDEDIRLNNLSHLSLDVNYRSTDNIVELTEEFIQCRRKDTSQKHMVGSGKPYNNPNFLIENTNSDDEAQVIYDIIKELKDKKSIKDSDVAILYRKHSDATIDNLINKFNCDDDIDYSIRGRSNLSGQGEVKSMITMLWYVSRKTHCGYVPSNDELDKKSELNLMAFCQDHFRPALDKSTQDYLRFLQQSFYDRVMDIGKKCPKKEGDGSPMFARTLKKNKTQDTLNEIFRHVEMPVIDINEIECEKDMEFFRKLEEIRTKAISKEPPEILKVFYELLSLMNCFDDVESDYKKMANLAVLTQTISNYETFISETDVRGLLFFLRRTIESYDAYAEDGKGVQLMTIHAAKGLEFPVTIIISLEKDNFPMANNDPEREKDYIFPNDTYYTPNECLAYKTVIKENDDGELVPQSISIEEENHLNDEEEERILYVAMTRAADLLILSTIGEPPEQIDRIRNCTEELNLDDLSEVTICEHYGNPEDEKLVLNYSKYTQYSSCPFKFNLGYNLGFTRSGRKAANRGTVFHNIMEEANNNLIDGHVLSEDELNELIHDYYKSMFDIDENPEEFEEFKENVVNYYETYSLNKDVIGAEYDFEIDRGDYLFNGSIDLIYKVGENELEILDYKYAKYDDDHIKGYTKQLHLYAAALKSLPEFDDFTIKKAITHFVLDDHKHEVDITDEKIAKELKGLDEAAQCISCGLSNLDKVEKYFPKVKDGCEKCSYRVFCKH